MQTTGFEKHRLAGLQDGVYAIAMTLLVLELKLQPLEGDFSDAQLWAALVQLWPKLLTWLISFWVLAMFWISDVRALAVQAQVDKRLLRLALLKLALVSLLPFSTALMGEHGNRVAGSAVYALHLVALALIPVLRLWHQRRQPALVAWPDADAAAEARWGAYSALACTLLALGLAFVRPGYNMLALLPMALLSSLRRMGRGVH